MTVCLPTARRKRVSDMVDRFFVPVHDDYEERSGVLRVDHVVRLFQPDDSADTCSVGRRFYADGAIRLGLVWLDDDTGQQVTVRLSPDMARYLASVLLHAAVQLEGDAIHVRGSQPFGSSYDVDF